MSFRDKVKAFEILTTHNSCEQDVFIDELENLIDLEAETADVKVSISATSFFFWL